MAKLSSTDKPVTKAELQEFYQQIFPYLGGNKAVDSSPIGTVISYMGATPPAGYLACDGSKLSATAFPLLFDVLKELPSATRATWGDADWTTEFNVPNLQGEFLRGTGTNSHTDQGSGANVGQHQDGTGIPYVRLANGSTGQLQINIPTGQSESPYSHNPTNPDSYSGDREAYALYDASTKSSATGTTSFYGIRPTNTSVLYCIKYTYVFQEVNYSENEIVVGKDEDGNDVYQRVVKFTMNIINDKTPQTKQIDLSSWGIAKFFNVYGTWENGANLNSCWQTADLSTYYSRCVGGDANNNKILDIKSNRGTFSEMNGRVVVEYTKTS